MESLRNSAGLKGDPPEAPAPFEQPAAGLDPEEYFRSGHFRAAVARTTELIPEADDVPTALNLWYIRIQSLLFLQLGHQAAEETSLCLAPLEQDEFLASISDSDAKLMAWKLRLILVPVRTKGINQSTIQLYYSLGAEARQQAVEGPADPWLNALQLSGLYAVSALIAMRDYLTVINLLSTQYNATKDEATARLLALIYVYIGDTLSARDWVSRLSDEAEAAKLKALYTFADSDSSENIVPVISEVYSGRITEAIAKLEERLVAPAEGGIAMNANIGNLFMLYDLCYADARQRRVHMAEKMVSGGNKFLESIELQNEIRKSQSSVAN